MPDFYTTEQTSRSRRVLAEITSEFPDAILIGGWGTWVRVNGAMSHDIDMIISRADLGRLRSLTADLSESRHLAGRKWRATRDGIHLDLYVPYDSRLGQRLELRTEHLTRHAEMSGGQRVLTIDAHIATKLAALLDRPDSRPGEKDRFELQALLGMGGDTTPRVLTEASARTVAELADMMSEAFGYLLELPGLSRTDRNALRRTQTAWSASM